MPWLDFQGTTTPTFFLPVTITQVQVLVSASLDEQGNKVNFSELQSLFQVMVNELRAIRWGMQYLVAQMEQGTGGGGSEIDLADVALDTSQEEVNN